MVDPKVDPAAPKAALTITEQAMKDAIKAAVAEALSSKRGSLPAEAGSKHTKREWSEIATARREAIKQARLLRKAGNHADAEALMEGLPRLPRGANI